MGLTPSTNAEDVEGAQNRSPITDGGVETEETNPTDADKVGTSEETQTTMEDFAADTEDIAAEAERERTIDEETADGVSAAYGPTEAAATTTTTETAESNRNPSETVQEAQEVYEPGGQAETTVDTWDPTLDQPPGNDGIEHGDEDWGTTAQQSTAKQEYIEQQRQEESIEDTERGEQTLGSQADADNSGVAIGEDVQDLIGDASGVGRGPGGTSATNDGQPVAEGTHSRTQGPGAYQGGTTPSQGEFADTADTPGQETGGPTGIGQQSEGTDDLVQARENSLQTDRETNNVGARGEDGAQTYERDMGADTAAEVSSYNVVPDGEEELLEAGTRRGTTEISDGLTSTQIDEESTATATIERIEGEAGEMEELRDSRIEREENDMPTEEDSRGNVAEARREARGEHQVAGDMRAETPREPDPHYDTPPTQQQLQQDLSSPEVSRFLSERNVDGIQREYGFDPDNRVGDIDGIGNVQAYRLIKQHGIESQGELAEFSKEDFMEVNGIGEQAAEQLADRADEVRQIERDIQDQADGVALELMDDGDFESQMQYLENRAENDDMFEAQTIDNREDIEEIIRRNVEVGRTPEATANVLLNHEHRQDLMSAEGPDFMRPDVGTNIASSPPTSDGFGGENAAPVTPVSELEPWTVEEEAFFHDESVPEQQGVDESKSSTRERTVTYGNATLEGTIVEVTPEDELNRIMDAAGEDIFQRVKVRDEQAGETYMTVFSESLEYPDEATGHATEDAAGQVDGPQSNLANEGVHPKEDRLRLGDKVRIENLKVDQHNEWTQTQLDEGNIDGNTVSTLPNDTNIVIRDSPHESRDGAPTGVVLEPDRNLGDSGRSHDWYSEDMSSKAKQKRSNDRLIEYDDDPDWEPSVTSDKESCIQAGGDSEE